MYVCCFNNPSFVCLHSETPKVEEPEKWTDREFSTLELLIHTHNKNPVERVSNEIIQHIDVTFLVEQPVHHITSS